MRNKITFSDLPSRAIDRCYAYSENAYAVTRDRGRDGCSTGAIRRVFGMVVVEIVVHRVTWRRNIDSARHYSQQAVEQSRFTDVVVDRGSRLGYCRKSCTGTPKTAFMCRCLDHTVLYITRRTWSTPTGAAFDREQKSRLSPAMQFSIFSVAAILMHFFWP